MRLWTQGEYNIIFKNEFATYKLLLLLNISDNPFVCKEMQDYILDSQMIYCYMYNSCR